MENLNEKYTFQLSTYDSDKLVVGIYKKGFIIKNEFVIYNFVNGKFLNMFSAKLNGELFGYENHRTATINLISQLITRAPAFLKNKVGEIVKVTIALDIYYANIKVNLSKKHTADFFEYSSVNQGMIYALYNKPELEMIGKFETIDERTNSYVDLIKYVFSILVPEEYFIQLIDLTEDYIHFEEETLENE